MPLARGYEVFRDAYRSVSGLCRTVRGPSMSATPGKVCVDGITEVAGEKVFVLHMIQARDPGLVGRPFFARFDPAAAWLSDLEPAFAPRFPFEPGHDELPGLWTAGAAGTGQLSRIAWCPRRTCGAHQARPVRRWPGPKPNPVRSRPPGPSMLPHMDINGTAAIISGGASGLGEATARELAAAGARVVVADLNEERGKAIANELGGAVRQDRRRRRAVGAGGRGRGGRGWARRCGWR